ncbi:MAG: efflux transporter outer membrane subunit [Parvularculaceae bacterium]
MNRFQTSVAVSAMIAVTLSACASTGTPARDLVQTPAVFDNSGAASSFAKSDADWWRTFGDPNLDLLTKEALLKNQQIAGGLAAVRAARASVTTSTAALLPQVNAGASASSQTAPNLGAGISDISANARASASWQVDLFGANRAKRRVSKANYAAQIFDQKGLELTVASDVASTYFSILSTRARLKVAEDNLAISERIFDLVKTRFSAGAVSRFDYSSQEASLANARARLPQLQQQLASFDTALAILLGRAPQGFEAPPGDILALEPPPINPGLPSDLLLRRPDLLSAEQQLKAADANVDAARAAFFPTIDLTAGLSALLTGGASAIGSLAASGSAPIFTAGRLEGSLEGAKARSDQAVASYRQAVLSALRDADLGLSALNVADARETQLQIARDAAAKALSISELQYKAGAVGLTTLLNAQSAYFSASDALIQGRLDRLSSAIDLYTAIGGGWGGAPKTAVQ